MKIRLASDLQKDSVVDGIGVRTVIWTQGCSHNCPGCQNPLTHDFNDGILVDVDEIKREIDELIGQRGITFSGGDPLFQIDAIIELAKYIKKKNMDVWVYTGFTYEEVLNMKKGRELLETIDVLVDGKFDEKQRTLDAPFRGSLNQKIIDGPASLKQDKIVLMSEYMQKSAIKYHRLEKEQIYI